MPSPKPAAERQDIYTRVRDTIAAQLEKGVRPWHQPWQGGNAGKPLRHNSIPYTGVNVLMLWNSALERGFDTPYWMTYNQSVDYGAHVRKGEKGSLAVYANSVTKKERNDETGEEAERSIPFLKGYTVFNACQIEGLPEHYYAKPPPKRPRGTPENRPMRDTSKPANGIRQDKVVITRARALRQRKLRKISPTIGYSGNTWAEDMAPQGCDQSADPEAGMRGRRAAASAAFWQ